MRYYSDLRNMQTHFSACGITKSQRNFPKEISENWRGRLSRSGVVQE